MKPLSVAADMAWRITAHEAASSGYRYLEKEHLLIGILSIEKVIADGPEQAGIEQAAWNNLKAEYSALRKALRSQGIDQTKLRRILRKKLGNGGYKHTENTIHLTLSVMERISPRPQEKASLGLLLAAGMNCCRLYRRLRAV